MSRFPEHPAIKAIEKYRAKCRTQSYYMVLDYLGLKLGMEYQVLHICDLDTDEVGYIPAIKFSEGNPLIEVGEDDVKVKQLKHVPMPSYSKCHDFVAKEYVYTLMQVTNLEKYALGDAMTYDS